MLPTFRAFFSCAVALAFAACAEPKGPKPPPKVPMVSGFATLEPGLLLPGPPSGRALDPEQAEGAPWPGQPLQGLSAILPVGDELLALSDNGFGTKANSPDFELRLHRLRVDFEAGELRHVASTVLVDPAGHLGAAAKARPLTGADLDPESFARAADGSFWIGEELGPSLVHVSANGELLGPPLPFPLDGPLAAYGRGVPYARSPDHPELAALPEPERLAKASVERSRGLEALAGEPSGRFAYAFLEAPLRDDPDRTRVPVLELDLQEGRFTGQAWWYRLEREGNAVTDAAASGAQSLVVLERDDGEGDAAELKRVYEVRLDRAGPDGRLEKRLLADLLDLADPDGHGPSSGGVLRLPHKTPEGVAVLGPTTLLVVTDDNFPFGKARGDEPEETELVRVELPRPIR